MQMREKLEEAWNKMLQDEAQNRADQDNECSACCGLYGTYKAKDYIDEVREEFQLIGQLYAAIYGTPRSAETLLAAIERRT